MPRSEITSPAAARICGLRMCSRFGRGLMALTSFRGSPPKLNRRSDYSTGLADPQGPTAQRPGARSAAPPARPRARAASADAISSARRLELHARVPEQGPDPRRRRAGRSRGRRLRSTSASAANSPLSTPVAMTSRHPAPVTVVHAGGDRPQVGLADGTEPELDPEHPLALLPARVRAGSRGSPRRGPRPRCRPGSRRPRRSARRRPARTNGRAPARAAPRGSRSSGGRATSTRPPAARRGRSGPRRSRPRRSARRRPRGYDRLSRSSFTEPNRSEGGQIGIPRPDARRGALAPLEPDGRRQHRFRQAARGRDVRRPALADRARAGVDPPPALRDDARSTWCSREPGGSGSTAIC